MSRIFLLSPARSSGRRAQSLRQPNAKSELARQLQIGAAPLGDVFVFCSSLYFRGKLAYARRFAQPSPGLKGIHIITPSRGLAEPEELVGVRELEEFSTIPVDAAEPRFAEPLRSSVESLATTTDSEVVLLGSVATGKYVDVLLPILGERLLFPSDFVGRGDMSRGGLMLRCAASGEELSYQPLAGASRTGQRAPRIGPRPVGEPGL